jgi:hypothetical protein
MDKERKERFARNEAVFREVNERIEELTRESESLALMCECGNPQCKEPLRLTVAEYERVRQEPTHFLVAPGHVIPEIEAVVDGTERFEVVRKLAGEGAFARKTDPRS